MKKIILLQTDVGYFDDVLSCPDIPLGLLRIAAFLKDDYKISLIDARHNPGWRRTLKEEFEDGDCLCVGITSMLGNSIKQAIEASSYVKGLNASIPVIWGGKHSTINPDITLKEENVDIVVRGEAEVIFNQLARAIDNKEDISNIRGISYKSGGRVIHNKSAELLDLNQLPPIPYELIDVKKYLPKMGGRRSINYESTRGCPVGCPFCYNALEGGRVWRSIAADKVVSDIIYLRRKYDIEHVYFIDDNLFCNIARLKEIAKGLISNDCRVTWDTQGACFEDIYNISDKDLNLLKASGLVRLAIGIQSGSKRIRALIGSRITDDELLEVNKRLKLFGIMPHYYFMVGLPEETQSERLLTVQLALKLIEENKFATTSSFLSFAPWPGTELFKLARDKYGLKEPDSLDYWIKEWDFTAVPWIPDRDKKMLHNLFLASMLYDRKAEWYSDSMFIKLLSALYRPIARFRIRHMFFRFMAESKLIELGKLVLRHRF